MYKLLVEDNLDGFSVIEARNASLQMDSIDKNPVEARKQIYRQILHFEKKGWLQAEGIGRNKRYYQTNSFKCLTFFPKVSHESVYINKHHLFEKGYSILENELELHQRELGIVQGEIEEYLSLTARFPELEQSLSLMLQRSQKRSFSLLGKVNVLKSVVNELQQSSTS